jgi:hypothetical protein
MVAKMGTTLLLLGFFAGMWAAPWVARLMDYEIG